MEKYKGWLIYDHEGADRNKQYIQMHFEEAAKLGMEILLVFREELTYGVSEGKVIVWHKGKKVEPIDFVICRTIDPYLSEMLEMAGFQVFNNSFVSRVANDKAKACAYLSQRGIPVPNSRFVKNENAREVVEAAKNKLVIKAVDGHGGKQVFLTGENSTEEILKGIGKSDIILQEFLENSKRDVRVYVLGKEILAAVCRTAKEGFKSNFSLGGKVELYTLSEEEVQLVEQVIDLFDFGLVGIDFLIDQKGKFVFNEIEDVVGARMLYQLMDINLVQQYLQFIKEKIVVVFNEV